MKRQPPGDKRRVLPRACGNAVRNRLPVGESHQAGHTVGAGPRHPEIQTLGQRRPGGGAPAPHGLHRGAHAGTGRGDSRRRRRLRVSVQVDLPRQLLRLAAGRGRRLFQYHLHRDSRRPASRQGQRSSRHGGPSRGLVPGASQERHGHTRRVLARNGLVRPGH